MRQHYSKYPQKESWYDWITRKAMYLTPFYWLAPKPNTYAKGGPVRKIGL